MREYLNRRARGIIVRLDFATHANGIIEAFKNKTELQNYVRIRNHSSRFEKYRAKELKIFSKEYIY